jgi:hypothetical protein
MLRRGKRRGEHIGFSKSKALRGTRLAAGNGRRGQTPRRIPLTILSLNRSNKMYIPFVQGQFNQGGSGALRFCGRRNLQLVVSRRNPTLLGTDPDKEDTHWDFTIVRRERPAESADGRRNSIYTFLAPVGVGKAHEPRHGEILSFSASSMPLFPDKDGAYARLPEAGRRSVRQERSDTRPPAA